MESLFNEWMNLMGKTASPQTKWLGRAQHGGKKTCPWLWKVTRDWVRSFWVMDCRKTHFWWSRVENRKSNWDKQSWNHEPWGLVKVTKDSPHDSSSLAWRGTLRSEYCISLSLKWVLRSSSTCSSRQPLPMAYRLHPIYLVWAGK